MVHATAISETANIYTRDRATVRTARWVCAEDDSHPSGGKFGDDILNRTLASPAMGHWGTSDFQQFIFMLRFAAIKV